MGNDCCYGDVSYVVHISTYEQLTIKRSTDSADSSDSAVAKKTPAIDLNRVYGNIRTSSNVGTPKIPSPSVGSPRGSTPTMGTPSVGGSPRGSTPDTRPPDTRSPDTRSPDTRPPDTRSPDTRSPDVKMPVNNISHDIISTNTEVVVKVLLEAPEPAYDIIDNFY